MNHISIDEYDEHVQHEYRHMSSLVIKSMLSMNMYGVWHEYSRTVLQLDEQHEPY